jgi:hypothetical protein
VEDEGLVEVLWCALPASKEPDERDTALLYRGERLVGDGESRSFFEDGFVKKSGEPPAGTVERVSGGLLYFEMLFATQTSIVHDGWVVGDSLEHAATSWDAWNKDRPDPTKHFWNNPGAGMPAVSAESPRPLLPRRVRVTFELEREVDRQRRTRASDAIAPQDTSLRVDNPKNLPADGGFIKLGSEWMQVVSRAGSQVYVKRAQRGTRAVPHAKGELVHFGHRAVREVPVRLYREDWS